MPSTAAFMPYFKWHNAFLQLLHLVAFMHMETVLQQLHIAFEEKGTVALLKPV